MTAPYNADQLALIAHMIAASKDQITATGTLTDRFTELWAGGMCQIDPSAQSVPVRILRNVPAAPGDRVTLIKHGSDWVVTGTFGNSWMPQPVLQVFGFNTLYNTSSTTAVDMPGPPTVTLTKRFDWSYVDVDLRISTFTNTTGTGLRASVLVNGVDYDVLNQFHNAVSDHRHWTGRIQITDLPGGDWPFVVRWRRVAGSGDLRVDTNDNVTIAVAEVAPPPA